MQSDDVGNKDVGILGSYVSVEVHGSFDIFPANPLIIFYKLK